MDSTSFAEGIRWCRIMRTRAIRADEEMGRINPSVTLQHFGMWMLGPALLEFASEEQKLHYLPSIARGQIRSRQGYSEPSNESDLAGLQTRVVDKEDHFLVNGAKISTS